MANGDPATHPLITLHRRRFVLCGITCGSPAALNAPLRRRVQPRVSPLTRTRIASLFLQHTCLAVDRQPHATLPVHTERCFTARNDERRFGDCFGRTWLSGAVSLEH